MGTSRCVMQEYFLTLFKSNVCAVIKNAADEKIQKNTPKDSKHKYQADRAHIIGRILFLLPRYLYKQKVVTTLVDLYEEGTRNKSLIREGRKFKRKKPIKYPLHRSNRKTTT